MITIAIIHIDKKILSGFGSCSFSDSGLFLLSSQNSYQSFLLQPCWFIGQNVFSDRASNLENSLKFFLILSFFLDFKASSLKCNLLIGKACETLPPNFLTEHACCYWFSKGKKKKEKKRMQLGVLVHWHQIMWPLGFAWLWIMKISGREFLRIILMVLFG